MHVWKGSVHVGSLIRVFALLDQWAIDCSLDTAIIIWIMVLLNFVHERTEDVKPLIQPNSRGCDENLTLAINTEHRRKTKAEGEHVQGRFEIKHKVFP